MVLSINHSTYRDILIHSIYHTTTTTTTTRRYMAEPIQRIAVVTGGNKGIGFEICRQLAVKGITVVLTARNVERGTLAQNSLKGLGLPGDVFFHQLDVVDPSSIAALAEFIKAQFGRLDILVNNAAIGGVDVQGDASILKDQLELDMATFASGEKVRRVQGTNGKFVETPENAEECIRTNYYGVKEVTKALVPFMKLSDSPRIVNVTSSLGNVKFLCNEWAKGVLSNEEKLTEELVDEVVKKFLKDLKEGSTEANEWPTHLAAYKISKAALNAYTRITAKKYPDFCINCVCPGYCRTDITLNFGYCSAAEGAEGPVKLAVMPDVPSGLFFYQKEVSFL